MVVNLVGHGFERVLQQFPSRLPVGFVDELGHSELARGQLIKLIPLAEGLNWLHATHLLRCIALW